MNCGRLVPNADSPRLLLTLEPEAAAVTAQRDAPDMFHKGDTILVLDCGGGTVDVTTHRLESREPFRLSLLSPASGGFWGSTCIDDRFCGFLEELFGPESMLRLRQTTAYLEVMVRRIYAEQAAASCTACAGLTLTHRPHCWLSRRN